MGTGRAGSRGMSLVETMVTLGIIVLLALVAFQMQLLGSRRVAVGIDNTAVQNGMRNALRWLTEDAMSANAVSIAGGVLTFSVQLEGVDRQVEYALEGNQLVRRLKDTGGTVLQTHEVSSVITVFSVSATSNPVTLSYTLRTEYRRAVPLEVAGIVYLRNASPTP